MTNKYKKPTEIDGIGATEAKDIHGEVLRITGCDITDLENGRGILNDNHAKGFQNTIGRVVKAKKIFTEKDCEDERQKYYWNKVKSPYIYFKGILFDDEEEHENAKAAAAVLNNLTRNKSPLQIKSSVEGGTIARGGLDNKELVRTKVNSLALTFVPANYTTLVEPISLSKSDTTKEEEQLIKNAMSKIQTDVPTFIEINKQIKIEENIEKLKNLKKSITAGFGSAGSPTDLTGGGVLQSESLDEELKYITCNKCGKEQVLFKNQVRCRNCGKQFRLKHLVKIKY
jgi:hypothetical protein